jgi:hypothetical protein
MFFKQPQFPFSNFLNQMVSLNNQKIKGALNKRHHKQIETKYFRAPSFEVFLIELVILESC